MKKLLFITGTRADYGKLKALMKATENDPRFDVHIFVSGMHLVEIYGNTYKEILKDGYKNVYVDFSLTNRNIMSYDLGNVICSLTGYVSHIKPDMIIVHGDRIDALAGAIVGALNNVRVAHIEGGELSGTIDESMRHAITKFSHVHLVSNDAAKKRLIQLGERKADVHVIGSPDIDIMLGNSLPTLETAKARYDITFDKYAFLMYHPVTTDFDNLKRNISTVVDVAIASGKNFIVIYPNNDYGSEIILAEYSRLSKLPSFKIYSSLRFEYFLTLLKHADFIMGNSSAGIRESGIYGIPAIDIGNRQRNRYSAENVNLQHVDEDATALMNAILNVDNFRRKNFIYGKGDSTEKFMAILTSPATWQGDIQKHFVDISLNER